MADVLAALAWAGATSWLLGACWRVSGRLFPADAPLQRLLHTGVLSWAVLVAAATLLGLFSLLTGPLLAGTVVVTAAAALAATRGRTGKDTRPTAPADRMERYALWGWLAAAAFVAGWVVVAGVWQFPRDWDSLNYHIPLIDQWLHARSLYVPDCPQWYVPGNNEVLGLWLVGLFSGDFLIGLINLPAAALLALGTLELGRGLGLRRPFTHLSALAVTCTGVALQQLLTAKNDLAAAALFMTALAYVFRHTRGRRAGDVALAAMSIGLLAGIKYYALGYAAVAGGVWVFCGLAGGGVRPAFRNGLWGMAGGLAWGGYWYLRNTLLTGTPIYPKGLTQGTDVLSEWRGGVWSTTLLGNGSPEVFPLTLEAVWAHGGLVQYVACLLMPGLVVWLLFSGVVRGLRGLDSAGRAARLGLALAITGSGLVWGVIPFAVETEPGTLNFLRGGYLTARFGLCFLSVTGVGLAVAFSDLWESLGAMARRASLPAGAARVALLAVAVLGVGWHLAVRLQAMIPTPGLDAWLLGMNALAAAAVYALVWHTWPTRRGVVQVAALGILAGLFAAACSGMARSWHQGFARAYSTPISDQPTAQLQLADPESVKLCALLFKSYPFFGSRRQFRVCGPVWPADEMAFRRFLWEQGATHVVVDVNDPSWAKQYERMHPWVVGRPELFSRQFEEHPYLVYRVDRQALRQIVVIGSTSAPPSKGPKHEIQK